HPELASRRCPPSWRRPPPSRSIVPVFPYSPSRCPVWFPATKIAMQFFATKSHKLITNQQPPNEVALAQLTSVLALTGVCNPWHRAETKACVRTCTLCRCLRCEASQRCADDKDLETADRTLRL